MVKRRKRGTRGKITQICKAYYVCAPPPRSPHAPLLQLLPPGGGGGANMSVSYTHLTLPTKA